MKAPFRVAIAGCGTSGLAAAVELALARSDRQIEITLFDARHTPGGRTRSFIDKTTGDVIDNGQHLMMGCYTSTLRYLRQIGSLSKLHIQSPLSIPYYRKNIGKIGSFFVPTFLPVPLNLTVGMINSNLLAAYEKMAALRFGTGVMLFRYDTLFAEKTCKQLFVATQQPDTLIEKLWEPVILATMNTSVAEASAQVFLNVIRTIFLTNRKFSTLLVPACGLSELLIEPAMSLLEQHRHQVRLSEEITSAHVRSGVVYLTTNLAKGFETFDAFIIAASPLPDWASEFIDHQNNLSFSPIVNLYFWLNKKILDSPINGFLGTSVQWAFPKVSQYSEQMLACTVSAADTLCGLEPSEITTIIENDLRGSLPHIKDFTVSHSIVIKEKRATYRLNPVTESERPHCRTGSPNVFVASDLATNGLPMTIEGSVRNGVRAAESILNDHLFIQLAETHWAEKRISLFPRNVETTIPLYHNNE
ncbi:MAG TPA: hydroxysqualene dehydroxylase HpnE [Candidatus Kapabacteria bacterium]|nr:hydroxysqualene dehydroxylase HpnE [Candidatus Kapabacteria bacterium]